MPIANLRQLEPETSANNFEGMNRQNRNRKRVYIRTRGPLMPTRFFQQPLAVLAMMILLPNAVCHAGCVELPKPLEKRAAVGPKTAEPAPFLALLTKAAMPARRTFKTASPC
jgi:hypothetical protein